MPYTLSSKEALQVPLAENALAAATVSLLSGHCFVFLTYQPGSSDNFLVSCSAPKPAPTFRGQGLGGGI